MMLLPFKFKKAAAPGWRPDELAECFRVVDLLIRAGLAVSIQTGVSDEGEPWGVVVRDDTGDMLLHLARTDGQFLVASAVGTPVQRGRNLRAVINAAFSSGELALVSQRAQLRDGDVLRLHPSALMAAVIVTAWLHTETGPDIPAASRPDRSAAGGCSTGAVRLGSDAAHTPYPAVLMKAAVSFAAVVAALEASSSDWMPLKLDIDALVTLAAAPQLVLNGSSLSYAGMEANGGTTSPVNFDTQETIMADRPAHVPSSSEVSAEAALAETPLPAILTSASGNTSNVVVPSASFAASAVMSWSTSGPDLSPLAPSFANRDGALILPSTDEHGQPSMLALPSAAMARSLNHAEPQNSAAILPNSPEPGATPVAQTLAAFASVSAGAAYPVASAILQPASTEVSGPLAAAGAENSNQPNTKPLVGLEAGPFFGTALHFLKLDQACVTDVRTVGTGNFFSLSNVTAAADMDMSNPGDGTSGMSLAAASTANLPEALPTATTIMGATSGLAPVLAPASNQSNAAANGAVLSTVLTSAPPLDQPTIPTDLPTPAAPMVVAAAPPAPPVPNNTQLLLNFTNDAANATKASAEAWTAMIATAHDTAGASRILVFDASWLSGKAFMLMPGVAMVENDLFVGAAQVELPTGSPVTLDIGEGLSVQLLGILTV